MSTKLEKLSCPKNIEIMQIINEIFIYLFLEQLILFKKPKPAETAVVNIAIKISNP